MSSYYAGTKGAAVTKQGSITSVRATPVNWLRRRFRARRGYLRFLVRAQYVGWGINGLVLDALYKLHWRVVTEKL